ncbi:MAG: FeoB-associated Cys-rich membrane protein [Lachnospiraceae bacterium]|nr:FeoB-associated Cys-rich membrane protein [Lachnospiraceae bacterium]
MNTSDIVVLIILAVAIILAIVGTIRNNKKGHGCGGNCAACGFSENCKNKK